MGSVALPLYSKINTALCGCSLFRHRKALETPRLISREVLARARREAEPDLFCVSSREARLPCAGSVAWCPCAGHYPAAGTSCWN